MFTLPFEGARLLPGSECDSRLSSSEEVPESDLRLCRPDREACLRERVWGRPVIRAIKLDDLPCAESDLLPCFEALLRPPSLRCLRR